MFPRNDTTKFKSIGFPRKTLILMSAAILQHVSLGLMSFQEWLFGIVFMKPLKEGDVT